MNLINDDTTLTDELHQTGYKKLSHDFSPDQVDIIGSLSPALP